MKLHGKPTIVALHCSGSSGRQWDKLASALGERCSLIAPDLIGCGVAPPWGGERQFSLTEEASHIVNIVDAQDGPIHLVGHSYGGCIALCVARSRPERIASLSLYEPTAFHLLPSIAIGGRSALDEIRSVAGRVSQGVLNGDYRGAACRFVDYWSGEGTWNGMKAQAQAEIVSYIPKAPLEFSALIGEGAPLAAFRRMAFPVLLMQGTLAPEPTALIARMLLSLFPDAVLEEIPGAGHMGPFSHPVIVNAKVAGHVFRAAGLNCPADQTGSAAIAAAT